MAKTKKKESSFQSEVIREIKDRFPGCVVQKNATGFHNGFPDLMVLIGEHWAMLEVKRERAARRRPNQKYWVDKLDAMSFARVIFPENCEEVMNELQQAFGH